MNTLHDLIATGLAWFKRKMKRADRVVTIRDDEGDAQFITTTRRRWAWWA